MRERLPGLSPRLVVCGSCRDQSDERLLDSLKKKAEEMEISRSVSFMQNLKFEELLQVFSEASIGIHTMKAEHFGIAVVELISAGMIVVAHNSAGPKYDIIREKSDNFGFLCQDLEDYVNSIEFVLKMKEYFIGEGWEKRVLWGLGRKDWRW